MTEPNDFPLPPRSVSTWADLPRELFPFAKRLDWIDERRFAYISALTLGRARINITTMDDLLGIRFFY